jgi:hypothetical protein
VLFIATLMLFDSFEGNVTAAAALSKVTLTLLLLVDAELLSTAECVVVVVVEESTRVINGMLSDEAITSVVVLLEPLFSAADPLSAIEPLLSAVEFSELDALKEVDAWSESAALKEVDALSALAAVRG